MDDESDAPKPETAMTNVGMSHERATLLIVVTGASMGFALAFNLGAFGVVFYDRILAVWVMASIVLVASIITKLPPRGWAGRLILVVPTIWLVLGFISGPVDSDILDNGVFVATLIITLLCLPFIAWMLISAINPDFLQLPNRNKAVIVATVLAFAAAGWGLGYRNDTFLNCDDFKVSGNDLPQNCVKVTTSN